MARRRVVVAVGVVGVVWQLGMGSLPAQAATAAAPWDFDGNGSPELVVGAPSLRVAGHRNAGGVAVVDSTTRAVPRDARVITQSSPHVVGSSRSGDRFGSAVVSADFDGDGYADLAVGHPGERVAGAADAGAVTVLYGTRHGLTGSRSAQLVEPGGARPGARFGAALAVVDLDNDGRPDLAVGAPGDVPRGSTAAQGSGSVTVLHGSGSGLTSDGSTVLRGTAAGPYTDPDVAFGTALTVGHVIGGPGPDLIVLSSGRGEDGTEHAGSVSYCPSGSTLPTTCTRLEHTDFMTGTTQVVVGHFLYGQIDQPIAMGPEIVVGSVQNSAVPDGAVLLLRLAYSRVDHHPYVILTQTLSRAYLGVPVEPGSRAEFGASLAVGDVVGDDLGNTYDDLVVGAPGEQVDGRPAGRVFVVPGGSQYLEPSHLVAFDEQTPGVPGRAASGDRFGGSVALVDRNGDGKVDLVIGAPGKDRGRGRVTVLPGTGTGFDTAGAGSFSLATFGRPQRHTGFGSVLGG